MAGAGVEGEGEEPGEVETAVLEMEVGGGGTTMGTDMDTLLTEVQAGEGDIGVAASRTLSLSVRHPEVSHEERANFGNHEGLQTLRIDEN